MEVLQTKQKIEIENHQFLRKLRNECHFLFHGKVSHKFRFREKLCNSRLLLTIF